MSRFTKNLNSSYNHSYNEDYKNKELRLHLHFLVRIQDRKVNRELIKETIKTGKLNKNKSEGNKLYIERYFGKINRTCVLILINYKEFVEARTLWLKKGN